MHCSEMGSLLLVEVIQEPAGCPGQINPPQLSSLRRRTPPHAPALWGSRCHSAWCDPVKASPDILNHIPLEQGHIWYKHDPVPKELGLIPVIEPQSSREQGELQQSFDHRRCHFTGDGAAGEIHSFMS